MSEETYGYVKWRVFTWALAIVFILFGTVFNLIIKNSNKLDVFNRDASEIKIQLSQIQTDILWIKLKLTE